MLPASLKPMLPLQGPAAPLRPSSDAISQRAGRAEAFVAWLKQVGLSVVDGQGRLWLTPWLDHHADGAVCLQRRRAMRQACPWLNETTARTFCTCLIERAHAERADRKAVQNSLKSQVFHLMTLLAENRSLASARVPAGAEHLLNLRAPHYDGCLFNPDVPIDRGGQGFFFVGLTTHKHAVAIKKMAPTANANPEAPEKAEASRSAFAREAYATRQASKYDVLQLYCSERHQFMVMPLFNGDLRRHAGAFLSLHGAADGPKAQGLYGARYVLRQLVAEVAQLHGERRMTHQDIKASNIFLHREARRFVLGDLGMASVIGENGWSRPRGYTPTLAAPEQFNRALPVGPKVDIFGLATTLFELLTTECPAVVSYRARMFPDQTAVGLFPHRHCVPQMHEAHRAMVFAALDGTRGQQPRRAQTQQVSAYQAHFESIHRSVGHLDPVLATLLRRMLQHDPAQRPSAAEVLAWMGNNMRPEAAVSVQIENAWVHGVPRFSPPVLRELTALAGSLDKLATVAR